VVVALVLLEPAIIQYYLVVMVVVVAVLDIKII
jgi:hypothetical protein